MIMEIIACQLDLVWEDKHSNYARVEQMLAEARPAPGSMIVLPEMFATGFSMNAAAIQESPPSATLERMAGWARRWSSHVMGGLVTPAPGGQGFNQSVTVNPEGKEVCRYTKIQPFSLGTEDVHYQAGDVVHLFQAAEWTVAPFVCYDLRFPEIFRHATRRGAELFVVIANWPEKRIRHWITLLQARAIENQAYVVGVNRVGEDPTLRYVGGTLILDPSGDILADAGAKEGFIRAQADREALKALREGLPFLKDMRQDFVPPPGV